MRWVVTALVLLGAVVVGCDGGRPADEPTYVREFIDLDRSERAGAVSQAPIARRVELVRAAARYRRPMDVELFSTLTDSGCAIVPFVVDGIAAEDVEAIEVALIRVYARLRARGCCSAQDASDFARVEAVAEGMVVGRARERAMDMLDVVRDAKSNCMK